MSLQRGDLLDNNSWRSLNGLWQYTRAATFDELTKPPLMTDLPEQIMVPFAVESALSGIRNRTTNGVGFYRLYTDGRILPPRSPSQTRMLLHIEASDFETYLWINGDKQMPLFPYDSRNQSFHRGGYNRITYDITASVTGPCENDANILCPPGHIEIIVGCYDPTGAGTGINPLGKQSSRAFDEPGFGDGTRYSSVSGIWGSVWLEGVPDTHITAFNVEAVDDGDGKCSSVNVDMSAYIAPDLMTPMRNQNDQAARAMAFTASITIGGKTVATASGPVVCGPAPADPRDHGVDCSGVATAILNSTTNGDKFRAWSPIDPFLYNISIVLHPMKDLAPIDAVHGYFGVRIIGHTPGSAEPLLNGEPLFVLAALDQGYWPDGLYTAPTDDALASDLVLAKALGFNAVRKHMKVEAERYYYHADRLGMLVLQDMPALDSSITDDASLSSTSGNRPFTAAILAQYATELRRLVGGSLRTHPSVVQWLLFSEAQGQPTHSTLRGSSNGSGDGNFTRAMVLEALALDPTRSVNEASGWTDYGAGNISDVHDYGSTDASGKVSPFPSKHPGSANGTRAYQLGECGGYGACQSKPTRVQQWVPGMCTSKGYPFYSNTSTAAHYNTSFERVVELYEELATTLRSQRGSGGLSGAVYTQLVDVEVECDGLVLYSREPKGDGAGDGVGKLTPLQARIKAANVRVLSKPTNEE
jgi:hypothetical protein